MQAAVDKRAVQREPNDGCTAGVVVPAMPVAQADPRRAGRERHQRGDECKGYPPPHPASWLDVVATGREGAPAATAGQNLLSLEYDG